MHPTDYLIRKLADGEFHSGVELGEGLQVSRTAVWKTLDKLKDVGLEVESVKGKGYRLTEPLDLLCTERLKSELAPEVLGELQGLEIFNSLESTNQRVLALAKEAPANISNLCLAEFQTSGRGRRGRDWLSPFGKNLCLSFGYTFREGFAALEGLSLAVGVMVADALKSYGVDSLQLKWPNDIWARRKKLGGILIEVHGEQGGPCHVVIGLGLNVLMRPDEGAGIDQDWTSLVQESPEPISRNQLAAAIINSLVPGVKLFEREGFGAFRARWEALDGLRDQPVVVQGPNRLEGVCRGIGRFGHLLIDTSEGMTELAAGEVSVRRL